MAQIPGKFLAGQNSGNLVAGNDQGNSFFTKAFALAFPAVALPLYLLALPSLQDLVQSQGCVIQSLSKANTCRIVLPDLYCLSSLSLRLA